VSHTNHSYTSFINNTNQDINSQPHLLLPESSKPINKIQEECKKIMRVINNSSNIDIFNVYNENEQNVTSMQNSNLSLFDGRLTISYHLENHVAYIFVIKTLNITILDHTEMRKNTLYYKIYILGLTTTLTQILPMAILLFFNIKICSTLKASTRRKQFLDRKQNKQTRYE
jgi:hypothetical protein